MEDVPRGVQTTSRQILLKQLAHMCSSTSFKQVHDKATKAETCMSPAAPGAFMAWNQLLQLLDRFEHASQLMSSDMAGTGNGVRSVIVIFCGRSMPARILTS